MREKQEETLIVVHTDRQEANVIRFTQILSLIGILYFKSMDLSLIRKFKHKRNTVDCRNLNVQNPNFFVFGLYGSDFGHSV